MGNPRPAAKAPLVHLTLDLRLTAEDMAPLVPSQIAAVFEGVGKLAALQHGASPARAEEGADPKPCPGCGATSHGFACPASLNPEWDRRRQGGGDTDA